MTDSQTPLFKDATQEKLGLTHIDRYEIQEQIGIGAMGIVYRVHDLVFACDRALKILRPELVDQVDMVQRFRDEGRAAVRASGEISHANIITVYDVGEFDERPYIVMELFRGVALDAVIESGRELGLLKVLQIGDQLAGALDSAHTHGVVHRDIKPGNVLLSEGGIVAKLTDFSVAQMRVGGGTNSLTRTGVVIGAPRYMPPEQALGKEVDGRSDLYGLGIMLYEMLTGERAYQSKTFTALLIEISQSELRPIKSLNKDVPPGVIAIVNKLVQKDPARRFQSASELRQALKREMRDFTIQEMKGDRGLPIELIGAALLSLLVAGLLGFTGHLLRNQQVAALETQTSAIGLEYAETLGNQISFDYARNGEENAGLLYQTQFAQGQGDTNVAYQHIVLDNGRVLASTNTDLTGGIYDGGTVVRDLSSDPDATQTEEGAAAVPTTQSAILIRDTNGETTLRVTQALFVGPDRNRRSVGQLHVGFPVDRIQEIGRLTLSLMLAMTALLTILVALLSYSIIRFFMAPLEKLRNSMQIVTGGDHSVRLPSDNKGVKGEAFRAFNGVARNLSELASTANLTPTEAFSTLSEDLLKKAAVFDESQSTGTAAQGEGSLDDSYNFEPPKDISPELADVPVDERTIVIPLSDFDFNKNTEEAAPMKEDVQAPLSDLKETLVVAASAPKTKPKPKAKPTTKSKSKAKAKAAPKRKLKPKPKPKPKARSKKVKTNVGVSKTAKLKTANKPSKKRNSKTKPKVQEKPTVTNAQQVDKLDLDNIAVDDATRVFKLPDSF